MNWGLPSRQLTVHWQPTMLKFHKESDFHLPESQDCLLGLHVYSISMHSKSQPWILKVSGKMFYTATARPKICHTWITAIEGSYNIRWFHSFCSFPQPDDCQNWYHLLPHFCCITLIFFFLHFIDPLQSDS